MSRNTADFRRSVAVPALVLTAALGIALGFAGSRALALMTAPSEHKGLKVAALGAIPEASMEAQIGLAGYKLQLREITIAPGGQIAKHSHEGRPGLVKVIDGTWTEGRPGTEPDRLCYLHADTYWRPERERQDGFERKRRWKWLRKIFGRDRGPQQ